MKLRTAIAAVLDVAFDLRTDTITVELSDGSTVTGRICRSDTKKIAQAFAHRLINVAEFNRDKATYRENKRIRRELTKEFGLEVD